MHGMRQYLRYGYIVCIARVRCVRFYTSCMECASIYATATSSVLPVFVAYASTLHAWNAPVSTLRLHRLYCPCSLRTLLHFMHGMRQYLRYGYIVCIARVRCVRFYTSCMECASIYATATSSVLPVFV